MNDQFGIPDWVHNRYIKFHFQTKDIQSQLNWPYFNAIRGWVLQATESLIARQLNFSLTIAPIHSFTAKTSIEQSDNEYSVIFDCNFGSLIKKLYHKAANVSSIPDIHSFLKQIIAARTLYLEKDILALVITDENISPLYSANFFDIEPELEIAREYQRAVPKNSTIEVNQFIDFYILAHEVFHVLRFEVPDIYSWYLQQAEIYFSFLKEKYYIPESYSEYREAQGKYSFPPAIEGYAEKQFKRFWEYRSKLYNHQSEHFVEEIAADLFAVDILLIIAIHFYKTKRFSWRFDSIFPTIYLISHTIYYNAFLEERALDFTNGQFIYNDQHESGLLRLRNWCVLEHLRAYVNHNVNESDEYKHMINESVAESQNYFQRYIELLFLNPLFFTLKAVSAKIKNKKIRSLYKSYTDTWSKANKIDYVSPKVESIWLSHYLR